MESSRSGKVDGSASLPDGVRGSVRVGVQRDSLGDVPGTEGRGTSGEEDVLSVGGLLRDLEVDRDGSGGSSGSTAATEVGGSTEDLLRAGGSSGGVLEGAEVGGRQEGDVRPNFERMVSSGYQRLKRIQQRTR